MQQILDEGGASVCSHQVTRYGTLQAPVQIGLSMDPRPKNSPITKSCQRSTGAGAEKPVSGHSISHLLQYAPTEVTSQ